MSHSYPLLFLPNFGPTEWIVICGIILLIFGPQKLPEIADAMGTSRATVARDWRAARALLLRLLQEQQEGLTDE